MGKRAQIFIAWSVPVSVGLIAIGFCALAGYLPPPHANDSAQELADFYRDDTDGIRLGLLLCFLGVAFYGPLTAAIGKQMLGMKEGATLAYSQMMAGAAAWVFLMLPVLLLEATAFRPFRSPETTQAMHDIGWFTLFMPIVPFCVQAVIIGVATLQDKAERPLYPRWFGYFNLWCALLFSPGGLLTFFKTGPFAYHGLLVYWIPLTLFGVWLLVLGWAVRYAALREDEPAEAEAEPVAA